MTIPTALKRMARLALSAFFFVLVGVGLLTARATFALAAEAAPPVDSVALSKAVVAMEQLDQMRISLASTLEGRSDEPTIETMKEVCMGLPRFGGQASGLHGCECTGVDGHLFVVDRTEVANR